MSNEEGKSCSMINPVTYLKKIISDPIPFLFFGSLIGLKVYHFIGQIDNTTIIINALYGDWSFAGIKAIIFNPDVMNSVYMITAIMFDLLIVFSYLIRVKPVTDRGKAQGFWEKWFPIITVLIPMVSFYLLMKYPVRIDNDFLFGKLYQSSTFAHSVAMAGFLFSLIGCTLSTIVLWRLRNSFSLMVEVRQLVTTGVYKYMRHPLYFSELTHALGTTLLLLNSATLSIYILFFTLEVIRAKFEERKFLGVLPEYADYKARTGFLLPKFRGAPQRSF